MEAIGGGDGSKPQRAQTGDGAHADYQREQFAAAQDHAADGREQGDAGRQAEPLDQRQDGGSDDRARQGGEPAPDMRG